jgi:hypothetical protein
LRARLPLTDAKLLPSVDPKEDRLKLVRLPSNSKLSSSNDPGPVVSPVSAVSSLRVWLAAQWVLLTVDDAAAAATIGDVWIMVWSTAPAATERAACWKLI